MFSKPCNFLPEILLASGKMMEFYHFAVKTVQSRMLVTEVQSYIFFLYYILILHFLKSLLKHVFEP